MVKQGVVSWGCGQWVGLGHDGKAKNERRGCGSIDDEGSTRCARVSGGNGAGWKQGNPLITLPHSRLCTITEPQTSQPDACGRPTRARPTHARSAREAVDGGAARAGLRNRGSLRRRVRPRERLEVSETVPIRAKAVASRSKRRKRAHGKGVPTSIVREYREKARAALRRGKNRKHKRHMQRLTGGGTGAPWEGAKRGRSRGGGLSGPLRRGVECSEKERPENAEATLPRHGDAGPHGLCGGGRRSALGNAAGKKMESKERVQDSGRCLPAPLCGSGLDWSGTY